MNALEGLPKELKVLVVDDHDLIRKSIGRILDRMGITHVVECGSIAEAQTLAETTPFDLCITDIYLGRHTGFDLLLAFRQRETRADVPFLFVTGQGTKEDIVRAVDAGADDYLLKPFQPEELERKVAKLLQAYLKPSPFLERIRSAERWLFGGAAAQALQLIDEALRMEGESARAHHLRAVVLDKLGRTGEAIAALTQNCERAPSFFKNYMSLADIHMRAGHVIEAIAALKQELDLNPKQVARQNMLAKLLAQSGDLLGAIDHYRVALRENPRSRQSLYGMAKAFAAMDNLDKALYYLKRVRRYHPAERKALHAMVRVTLDAGKPRLAEFVLKDEKRAFPKRLDTYAVLAQLYLSQERWEEAEAVVTELLKIEPANADGLKIQASLHLRGGQLDAAAEALAAAVAATPDLDGMLRLADVHLARNKPEEAARLLVRCVRRKSCPVEAWDMLARAYLRSGEAAKAYFLLVKLQRSSPQAARQESLKKAREAFFARRPVQRAIA